MEAELYTPNAGGRAGLAAPAPGTPVSALVGILYERDDIQTLNSYARLIWVCTHSPKRSALSNAPERGENATFRSFCIAEGAKHDDSDCRSFTSAIDHRETAVSASFFMQPAKQWLHCDWIQKFPGLPGLFCTAETTKRQPGSYRVAASSLWAFKRGCRRCGQYPAIQIHHRARSSTGRSCACQPRPCTRSPAGARTPRSGAALRTLPSTGSTTRQG